MSCPAPGGGGDGPRFLRGPPLSPRRLNSPARRGGMKGAGGICSLAPGSPGPRRGNRTFAVGSGRLGAFPRSPGGRGAAPGETGGSGPAPATAFRPPGRLGHRHHRAGRGLERRPEEGAKGWRRTQSRARGAIETGKRRERHCRKEGPERGRRGKMAATKRKRRGGLAVPAKRPRKNGKDARPPAKPRDKAEEAEEEDRNRIPGPVCKVEGCPRVSPAAGGRHLPGVTDPTTAVRTSEWLCVAGAGCQLSRPHRPPRSHRTLVHEAAPGRRPCSREIDDFGSTRFRFCFLVPPPP